MRKELESKKIGFLFIKRKSDIFRIRPEKAHEKLEKNNIFSVIDSEETKIIASLEQHNKVIRKMTRDKLEKNVLLKEIQTE